MFQRVCCHSLEFCNETLLMHQLRALKEAGISEVLICVHERVLPASWDAYVAQVAQELEVRVECVIEDQALGNAGAFKAAEAKILAAPAAGDRHAARDRARSASLLNCGL